jgi:hypothetical protein
MAFLNDLNLLSIAATVITVAICGCVLSLDIGDWLNRRRSAGQFDGLKQCIYLCFLSVACLVGTIDAFSPSANVPHKTVTGEYRVVHISSGKGGSTFFICVVDCTTTGGYTLAMNDDAHMVLRKRPEGGRYEFDYLDRPSGNGFTGVSLRVVGIRDAGSGAKLYEVDLVRHWGRVFLFTSDFLLLIGTGILCVRLERPEKKKGKRDDEAEDPEPVPDGRIITSLDLPAGNEHSSGD